MRVTSSMLTSQVIHNLGRNLERYARIEEQLSSARRINRPSDDPIGLMKVLEYRHQQVAIEQHKKDVQHAQAWLSTTDNALADINAMLIEAFDIVVNLSNDTIGDDQRASMAGRVDAIIEQILDAANSEVGGRQIFSGTTTDVRAIEASSSGVVFRGNTSLIGTKIGESAYMDINSVGEYTFTKAFTTLGRTADLNVAVTLGTRLIDLNAGLGVQQAPGVFRISDRNGTAVANVDLSAATTVGDAIAAINSALSAAGIANLTASIAPTGDGIRLQSTPNGFVSGSTRLANLNDGRGVDLSPGRFIMRKIDGSAEVMIDLSGSETLQDVISKFNTQMSAAGFPTVSMLVSPTNQGLLVLDANVPPDGFEFVEEDGVNTTAADLGLSGTLDFSYDGAALNPQTEFEVTDIAPGLTTAADMGLLGRFNRYIDGTDLNPNITTASNLSDLNGGLGFELGRVRIASGHQTRVVDLSTASTVSELLGILNGTGLPVEARINDAQTGIEIYSTLDDRSLILTSESSRTAEYLGIVGSPDLFGSLYLLRQALQENNGDMVRTTNESIQGALDQILYERSNVGAKQIRLETAEFRLLDKELNVTRLRSEYEDADILAVSSDLSKQEAVYQAALAAAARMIQPSLSDFLR